MVRSGWSRAQRRLVAGESCGAASLAGTGEDRVGASKPSTRQPGCPMCRATFSTPRHPHQKLMILTAPSEEAPSRRQRPRPQVSRWLEVRGFERRIFVTANVDPGPSKKARMRSTFDGLHRLRGRGSQVDAASANRVDVAFLLAPTTDRGLSELRRAANFIRHEIPCAPPHRALASSTT